MPFEIACAILALTVRLIDGLAVDPRARGPRVPEVRVDIVNLDEQPRIRHVGAQRRFKPMFGCRGVQEDGGAAGTHFPVNSLAFGSSMHTPRSETERVHQEVVCGRDVPIGEKRNDAFDGWHACSADQIPGGLRVRSLPRTQQLGLEQWRREARGTLTWRALFDYS
jgi:hypothetical protein